jgi:hypothetical protein
MWSDRPDDVFAPLAGTECVTSAPVEQSRRQSGTEPIQTVANVC